MKMMDNPRPFLLSLSAALLTGLLSVVFVLVWALHYTGGLAWRVGALYNWHAVFTVVGYVFLQGIAIIVFRLPWTWQWSKLTMKLIHAGLHLMAFICAVVAMVAIFFNQHERQMPHMFSLHSWVGLSSVILFCLQLVLGVVIYLIPVTPVSWKGKFMPIHVYGGRVLFGTVIAVALIGITERLIFSLRAPAYRDLPPEALFVNFLGLLLLLFGILILWIGYHPSWKRPSDQSLQSLHTNGGGDVNTKDGPALFQFSEGDDAEGAGDVRKRNNSK